MRAGQKYFWPALFALERGRRGTCCIRIFEVLEGTDILNADILDMLASTLMDDFASTSFAIVIHGITPLFFLMALFYRRRCPI